ncbi:uncharacterized protein [Aquarana catesbeiana]|uniref:uncharacterized protein isoform X5 n=1 Tax=Aquarana catesbeiana TaxID=8400 RepID=UPI003CC9EABC
MMSVGAVTTEDGKVCYKTAEGSVININISQPSYWDYLNDGVNGLRKIWSDAPPTFNEKIAALPLTLGVSQFPMGIISVAFYAIVLVTDLEIFRGAPLWMGIPFILSGPFEVVAYIKKQGFWGLSNGLLIMLLIIGSWGVISSTITIIYRLQTECEFCNTEKGPAEEDMEPLEKTPLYTITV